MYNHNADSMPEAIGVTEEFHHEVADQLRSLMMVSSGENKNSEIVERIINYMGTGENLDITKSIITHLVLNLIKAKSESLPTALKEILGAMSED